MEKTNTPVPQVESNTGADLSRRRFFQLAGGVAGAGLLFASCRRGSPTDVYVGSGDAGVLNYLYIIQQIEAAFYTQAVTTPYYGLTSSEQALLTELRDQEIAHKEFMQKLIGNDVVRDVEMNFSAIVFADRTSFLTNAIAIEDLAVASINGAVRILTNTDYVKTLMKMAPVEARHSAYARDLLTYNSFADGTAVNSNGLDLAIAPLAGMNMAQKYLQSRFDTSKLPSY